MSESESAGDRSSAAVLQSMTLLATLSTAEDVRSGIHDRRTGRDPSAQAPSDLASVRLHRAGDAVMDLLMQLVFAQVPDGTDENDLAHAVRHFDLLMKLRRTERLVKKMHQHLLSLYPDVSEALVEEARRTHADLEAVTRPHAEGPNLADVLQQGMSFVVWTRHEVE